MDDSQRTSKRKQKGRDDPLRSIRGAPFCWQEKKVLRQITEAFDDRAAIARSVYVAFTELASDNQSEVFTASKALIAHKAGVSLKTVERLLPGFEQLGILKVDRVGSGVIRVPNTYSLLPLRPTDAPLRPGRKQRQKSDKVEESGRISEKKEKNVAGAKLAFRKTKLAVIAAAASNKSSNGALSPADLASFKSDLAPYYPKLDINDEWERFGAHCSKETRAQTAERFISWLDRAQPTLRLNEPQSPRVLTAEDFEHYDA